jgi:hypothetical protein
MVANAGVEGTLRRLHDAGVFVQLEEFKGIRPIRRGGLEFPVRSEDFDNPLSARQYEGRTGGSGGSARRILLGLDLLEHESAYHALFYDRAGPSSSPVAMWLPAPPGAVGIKNALIRAKLGQPVEQWFAQNHPEDAPARHALFAAATRVALRWSGSRIPAPEYTPASSADRVATWMAAQRRQRGPATLLTTPSAAVRTCASANARGLDISGSLFVLVGEPFTDAKAAVVESSGARAVSHYAMVEAGMIGLACLAPSAPDDVHLVVDKIATIQRDRSGGDGSVYPALFHSTLLPASPKVMLNVESGDYGVLEERDCGCGVLPAAFGSHLHTIRSYEKLTSEGMHFLGKDLLELVEVFLPGRFGGGPTDYQLAEREIDGLPKVIVVAHPSVGPLDPEMVVRAMLEFLRQRGIGQRLMSDVWENGDTFRVERRAPDVTPAGKILPLRKVS